jgi:hypothetical protein
MERVVNARPWLLYTSERDPVLILKDPGYAPRPVWMGAKNVIAIGIRSPGCPARNE